MSERGDPYVWLVERVWRYHRGDQNPSIGKGQTANCKMTNNDQHKPAYKSALFSNWCMTILKGWNE
jgi:hypothetical protein